MRERPDLVIEKIRQCRAVFDFTEALSDLKSKEIKRAALNEIIDYIANNRKVARHLSCGHCTFGERSPDVCPQVITEEMYPEIVGMFSVNLFRATAPPETPNAAEVALGWLSGPSGRVVGGLEGCPGADDPPRTSIATLRA